MLSESINLESIQIGVEVDSFEEAIQKSLEPLVQQGYVQRRYVDEVIKIYHETGPYIVITKNIALPHAPSSQGAIKMGIGFTKLKEPVVSGSEANDPVKYLFPLSAPDSTSHIHLLSELADLLGDADFIDFLGKVETKEEFINSLKKFEGNDKNA